MAQWAPSGLFSDRKFLYVSFLNKKNKKQHYKDFSILKDIMYQIHQVCCLVHLKLLMSVML